MTLEKWIAHMKGKHEFPPGVHLDDDGETYWVGYKELYHGMNSEVYLAQGMLETTAQFFCDKVAELFHHD